MLRFHGVIWEVAMVKRVRKSKGKQRLAKIRDLTPKEGTPIKGGVANPLFERYAPLVPNVKKGS